MNPVKIPSKSRHDDAIRNDDLPEEWLWVEIGQIIEPSNERVNPNDLPDEQYVGLEHIESNTAKIIAQGQASEVRSTKTRFRKGDILYGKLRPYLNKACIPDFDGVCSTDILVFPCMPGIVNKYLLRLLTTREFVAYANQNMSGIQLPRVSFDKLALFPIPLSPLPEQFLIVSRVEELLDWVGKAKEELDKVSQIMNRFRQAVLKKAFSGELTAEWRAQQQNLEPAAEILNRIQEERKRRYEDEVKQAKAGGRRPPKNPKYLETEPLDTSDLPELPEEWVWCKLGGLAIAIEYGYTEKAVNSPIGPKFLRITDIQNGAVDWENVPYCTSPKAGKEYPLLPGDILIARTGATTGKHYLIKQCPEAIFASYLIRLRVAKEVLPESVSRFMDSELYWRQIADVQKGTAQPGANAAVLSNLAFSLPPLPEQQEIVRRVESLFKFADEVEKRVEEAKKRVEKITQSIFSKAFRGELSADFREAVKNWKSLDLEERKKYIFTLPEEEQEESLHADVFPLESAERLLERIQEERAKREQDRKDRKGSKTKKKQDQQLKLMEL